VACDRELALADAEPARTSNLLVVQSRLALRRWQMSITAGVVAFLVILLGGYAGSWSWTGFSGNDTLWDWLRLLLLPLILASAPIWMKKGSRMHRTRRLAFQSAALTLIVLIVLGYGLNMRWTGFPGNRLWDWFGLLLLPISLATIRVWRRLEREVTRVHLFAIAALAAAFGLFVAGGYALRWGWTGFQGNTLWDWIQLLLVPILFPLIVVPATISWMSAEIEEEADERADEQIAQIERACGTVRGLESPGILQ
jgi:hypothetical protein